MKSKTWQGMAAAGLLLAGGSAQAALVDAGNGLVNDTVLNITWVADPMLSGAQTWDNLVQWAASLVYAGYDDWRLASMGTRFNCSVGTEQQCIDSGNELGYMFHYNIAGSFPKSGDQTVGDVTLTGIQNTYWSGTEHVTDTALAWFFDTTSGIQYNNPKVNQRYGWAVRPGQVAAAPLPGTAALMALGLLGLGAGRWARRRLW
jgi:hypothetical protein